jgi:hypothetical protein
VRILFVLLGAITHGFGILVYVLLMIVMPVARTDEELAAAHGARPFNAHDFIEQAKNRYAEFQKEFANRPQAPQPPPASMGHEAHKKWREDMREWKRQWKADMRREKMRRGANYEDWADRYADGMSYAWHHSPVSAAGRGFLRFLVGLGMTILTIAWIASIWTLYTHGTILGLTFASGHPVWIPIVFLCAAFFVIATPFRIIARNAHPWRERSYNFFLDVIEALIFIFAIYLLVFTARELFPVVNEAWSMSITQIRTLLKL